MDIQNIKHHIKHHQYAYLISLVGVVCILSAFILGYQYAIRIENRPRPIPRQSNVNLIQTWMTVPYISKTYRVPELVIFTKLDIDPTRNRNFSLERIAHDKGKGPQVILKEVQQIITDYQTENPQAAPSSFETD